MKIKTCLLALGFFSLLALTACDERKNKSLSELKDEQTSAINQFVSKNKLDVVDLKGASLPDNVDPKVYYRLKNGLYVRVIDAGDKTKPAVLNETTVFAYIKGYQFNVQTPKTLAFDNLGQADIPEIEFKYVYYYHAGDVHFNLVGNTRPIRSYDALMCQGLAYPLSLSGIGNGAKLSLIIPFEIGPSSSYSSGTTTYVEELRYVFK